MGFECERTSQGTKPRLPMLRGRRNEFRQPEDDIQFSDISTILLNSGNVFKPDASVPKGQNFLRCKRSKFSTMLTLSFGINKNMFHLSFLKRIQFLSLPFCLYPPTFILIWDLWKNLSTAGLFIWRRKKSSHCQSLPSVISFWAGFKPHPR